MTGAEYFVFRLEPHDDLKKKIAAFVNERNIQAGAVISCVGSLEQVHLRFANRPVEQASGGIMKSFL